MGLREQKKGFPSRQLCTVAFRWVQRKSLNLERECRHAARQSRHTLGPCLQTKGIAQLPLLGDAAKNQVPFQRSLFTRRTLICNPSLSYICLPSGLFLHLTASEHCYNLHVNRFLVTFDPLCTTLLHVRIYPHAELICLDQATTESHHSVHSH